jgi:ActR/RegA family two-component response regulator
MLSEPQSCLLAGRIVLLVEDEYLLADEVRRALLEQGALVVGPFADVANGLAAAESAILTGAVLDINVRNEAVFPIAEMLRSRGLPFVFTTGYDQSAIPEHYKDVPRCEKPIDTAALVRALAAL